MNIQGVFFDLFGTLVDTPIFEDVKSDWNTNFYRYILNYNKNLSYDEFILKGNDFFSLKAPRVENDGLTIYERKLKRFCHILGIPLENECYHELADLTNNNGMKSCVLDPTAISMLKKIRKYKKIALITNFDHYPYIYKLLSHFKLEDLFDSVIISSEVGYKKPDPMIFKIALSFLKLNPENVIHIGDSAADVEGALGIEIIPILLSRFYSKNINKYRNEDVKTIMNLKEILKIINVLSFQISNN